MIRSLCAFVFALLFVSSLVCVSVRGEDTEEEFDVYDEPESTASSTPSPPTQTPGEEEYEEAADPEEIRIVSSPDLVTTVFFPDFPNKHFPVQSEVKCLIGITNIGDKTFNISYIGAHFHSPFDFSYYIQNFTVRELGVVVEPQNQLTLEYTFRPDKSLEPLEFWLSGWIYYNNSDNVLFRTTFQNGTIELTEKLTDFNVRRVFSYFFAIALAGLVGFFAVNWTKTKKKSERGTRDQSDDDQWLPIASKKKPNKRK